MAALAFALAVGLARMQTVHGDESRRLILVDREGYIDRVIESLEARVRAYGLVNLPVGDAVMELNRTVYGEYLLGKVFYSSGFVMAADPWTRYARFMQGDAKNDTAYILTEIQMPNIRVFYNIFANLTIGNITGTAIHVFRNNRVAIHIYFNMMDNSSRVKSMYPGSVMGPLTEYSPNTNLTRAVARMARLRVSAVIWEDIKTWISKLFISMLNSIVAEMPMPLTGGTLGSKLDMK